MIVNKLLHASQIENFAEGIEIILCEIHLNNIKFVAGYVNRLPDNNETYLTKLNDSIDQLCIRYYKLPLVLTGDFNFPNIDWSMPKVKMFDKLTFQFLCSTVLNGFDQVVNLL